MMNNPNSLFIPGNTASSKNSKRIVTRGSKTFLIGSKTTMRYKQNTAKFWLIKKNTFLKLLEGKTKPYNLGFYFVRDSKRKADYANLVQLPLDLMQEYGWLENDDMETVVPVFLGYEVDKLKAGVLISVL